MASTNFLQLLAELPPEQAAAVLCDPQEFAETFLKNPEGTPFRANDVQRRIFKSPHRQNVIRVHRRAGKAQPLTATIYTPDGPSTMGAMRVGSKVCTPDGGVASVVEIHPQGQKTVYRLTLDDGTTVDACDDHLWEVYTKTSWKGPRGSHRQQYGEKVLTTRAIRTNLTYRYGDREEFNYKLPGIQPIHFEARDVPLDPYLLGVLIGDGYLKQRAVVSADSEMIERIEQRSGLKPIHVREKQGTRALTYFYGRELDPILAALGLSGKLSYDKSLPEIYRHNSTEVRLELLRGLMDTDGSSDRRRRGQAEFCTVSPQLAEDVAELARSLGCKVTVKESEAAYTKDGVRKVTGRRYRLSIRIPEGLEIFGLDRKKCGGLDERYLRRTIVAVEEVGTTEMQCITIDHPRHLYVTDHYIPTHNSHSFAIIILFHALCRKNCKILVIAPMQIQVKEIFDKVRAFMAANDWIEPYKKSSAESPQQRISFTNGSKITGLTTGVKSKSGALAARGQEADVVLIDEAAYLNEEDWESFKAILSGDAYRSGTVLVYVASTPAFNRGTYYKLCTDEKRKDPTRPNYWHEIYQDLPSNPDPTCTDEYKQKCKDECTTELEWVKEWLAQFPDLGAGVFPKSLVEQSRTAFTYAENLQRALDESRDERPPSRTIGVDWDKLNRDGHGPNIAVLEAQKSGKNRVIYREEIPQSEFALHKAVERVAELNRIFRPEWIFVDKGYGEYQIEEFQLLGEKDPESGLAKKVLGISFKMVIETPMPGGGPPDRKPFKHSMVNLLRMWFERDRIELSLADEELYEQFIGYEVVNATQDSIKYSQENEHGIDAVGLAAMAMHHKIKNPYGYEPARRVQLVDAPVAVPGKIAQQIDSYGSARGLQWNQKAAAKNFWEEMSQANSFSRGALGSRPPRGRSSF